MTNHKWELQANCFGMDTDIFYPEINTKEKIEQAKQICEDCPVRAMCLQVALDKNEKYGIWGGLTAKERKAKALQLARKAIASKIN